MSNVCVTNAVTLVRPDWPLISTAEITKLMVTQAARMLACARVSQPASPPSV